MPKFLSNILAQAGLIVTGTTNLNGTSTAITVASNDNSTNIATTAFVKTQNYLTGINSSQVISALGYTPVTSARIITINGTSYDLSADRVWTISSVDTLATVTARGATTNTAVTFGNVVSVNNTSPYNTSVYSLDINGGLLIKNTGKAASITIINADPSGGGNNAFVVHTVGGTSGSSYVDIQGYYGASITGSTTIRLNNAGGNVLVGSLAGSGTRMVVVDATGTLTTQALPSASGVTSFNTRTGAVTLSSSDVTSALGFTPYNSTNPSGFITGYTETDTLATVTGRGASTSSAITINTTVDQMVTLNATDSSWAYIGFSWAGVRKAYFGLNGSGELNVGSDAGQVFRVTGGGGMTIDGNTAIHAGNYSSYALPLSGGTMTGNLTLKSISSNDGMIENTYGGYVHLGDWGVARTATTAVLVNTAYRADYADSLFDMNISRFTNNSGYITSSASISGNAATATSAGYLTGGDSAFYGILYNSNSGDLNTYNTAGLYSSEYTGSTNRPVGMSGHWIQISDAGGTDVKTQWYYQSDGAGIYMRLQWGNAVWRGWRALLTDANYSSYAVANTYNTSLNSDSRNSRGVTRLYRSDSDSDYSIQTQWSQDVSGYWSLRGYSGDSFHAHVWVGRAGSAGSADTSSQVTINYSNDSNSTYQMLWGSGNSVYGTGGVYINPSSDVIYARGGFISPGNPWGTSDSAYFPNGITTAGSDNWIYGHTYVGNAPANGSGHEFWSDGHSYHRSNIGTNSHGQSARFLEIQSASGNFIPYSFESEYGNHSWGTVFRIRINQANADRPSLQFSSASSDNRWNIGYCYADDNFRVTQNMGYRNDNSTSDGWGTERFKIDTSGNISAGGSMTSSTYFYASGSIRLGDMWGGAGLYRPSGSMVFGIENSDWIFSKGAVTQAYFAGGDGNLWMRWAGDWLSNLLGAKAVHRGEGSNYVDYSRYVYNNGAYSGSGWTEPSDLGVRYANNAGSASSSDRLYPFASGLNDADIGYGMRVWYDWSYDGVYRNGFTVGSHPGDQSYGWQMWQNMWNDRTYTRRKNGGWQSTRTLLTAEDDSYAYNMNQNVRTSDYVSFYNVTISTSATASDLYVNGWFRNNANNCGLYSQANGVHFYASGGSDWNITGSGGNVALAFRSNYQTSIRGYVYGDTSNNIGFLGYDGNWALRMDSSKNLIASGDVTAYSDARVKTNVKTIENALDKINNLRGVSYNRSDSEDKKTKIGVIAQETLPIVPEVVNKDNDGMYNVSYGNFAGLFIEGFKEQQRKIDAQDLIIKELKNKLDVLTK